jgi:hypothetical protein
MRVNCLEDENLLKRQHWREKDGSRTMPPRICPHCKMIEWIREQIEAGSLEWSTPVFKFETEGDATPLDGEEIIIHAGGITGMFQQKDLTKAEQAQLRKAGVKQSEAYTENGLARMQYVFGVLSEADLDGGWVIATGAKTLGDKMKKAIRDEIKRCDGDEKIGHPKFNPYPFEWTYDENKEFSNKYDVVALSRKRPNQEVQALLEQGPPNFDSLIAMPKLGALMKNLKASALIDMPIDQFFADAIAEHGEGEEEEEAKEGKPRSAKASKSSKATGSSKAQKAQPEKGPEPEEENEAGEDKEEESVACDHCSALMSPEEMVCGNCGTEYEYSGEDMVLASRPCANPDCMEKKVKVNDDGSGVCGQCGTSHDADWNPTIPAAPKQRKARQSRGARSRATK